MVNDKEFRKVIDDDLMKLKFILKSKVATLDDIKKKEQTIIDNIKGLITSVRQIEEALEKEIEKYKRFEKGWQKTYAKRKWAVLGEAIRQEIENFNQEYLKTKDIYDTTSSLSERLSTLRTLLKKMNARNKESKEKELAILQDFKRQKTGDVDTYSL